MPSGVSVRGSALHPQYLPRGSDKVTVWARMTEDSPRGSGQRATRVGGGGEKPARRSAEGRFLTLHKALPGRACVVSQRARPLAPEGHLSAASQLTALGEAAVLRG